MTVDDADVAWAEEFCVSNGYGPPRVFGNHRWAAVQPRMFNATLVLAEIGDTCSYLDHWCYESPLAAAAALAVWDGQGRRSAGSGTPPPAAGSAAVPTSATRTCVPSAPSA